MADESNARKGPKRLSLITSIVIGGFLVMCGAAIAGPKFMRFQARSKQAEAKANLRAVAIAQQAYFEKNGNYVADASLLGFVPERGNRYAYFLMDSGVVEHRLNRIAERLDAGAVIISNDTFKHPGPEIVDFRQTGCVLNPGRDGDGRELNLGVTPGKSGGFIAAAATALDGTAFECWSVASMDRKAADGTIIRALDPYNESQR